jgi:hypothetical protein
MNEEKLREKMVEVGESVMDLIGKYFRGELKDDDTKIDQAFKYLPQAVKMMHMNQHRVLQERSQAIRLLPYLKDEPTRERYIKLTQPALVPLLESRPRIKDNK